ncbi:uncharacterized protein EI90DRAFT_3288915 [Cantharellus anzutake]|uniref:uncharacterized protein n=1 Tax=Cantharellus anzutake TaxID=1750568 RepID=UPI0019076A7D|nr:uncharacterized protein EI90DRAFT_3288915 [Cantharellus anzutake]KAF8332712.1 hypothetical protein EI90DRAFT_3288915 [Cantharellus anzutake]
MEMEVDTATTPQSTVDPANLHNADDLFKKSDVVSTFPSVGTTTAYIYDAAMTRHKMMNGMGGHPEQPGRVTSIHRLLADNNILSQLIRLEPRKVTKDEVLLVHSEAHWDAVQHLRTYTIEEIMQTSDFYESQSLYVSAETPDCAELGCGCTIQATLAVAQGRASNALAVVRPPGHHAEPEQRMGFCFFNNIAIAARVALRETAVRKILILDWDVHHGNGTQKAFETDPNVLYISIHQFEQGTFYPASPEGGMEYVGLGAGIGKNVNIPWEDPGMRDADYLYAFFKIVLPIAYEFAPDLVMVSAGFDAAEGDPVGDCNVTPNGFAHMAHLLSALAGGRMVVVLEGGYDENATSQSVLAVTRVLLGEKPPLMQGSTACASATQTIYEVGLVQSRFWKSINPKSLLPSEEDGEESISAIELLKAHRNQFMFEAYRMYTIPFANDQLEAAFGGQVICSKDIYDAKTMVVYVHDYGNLYAELKHTLYLDLNIEHSFMVDSSRSLIDWVVEKGWHLLDINIYPKPRSKVEKTSMRDAVAYLWDNYIEYVAIVSVPAISDISSRLSDAEDVVIVAQSSAYKVLVDLAESRDLSRLVKAIVQVVGIHDQPAFIRRRDDVQAELFKSMSYLALPESHPVLFATGSKARDKLQRRHQEVQVIDAPRATHLFKKAMPSIKAFIESRVKSSNVNEIQI